MPVQVNMGVTGGRGLGGLRTTQTELIQCRSFVTVWRSPKKTWPR